MKPKLTTDEKADFLPKIEAVLRTGQAWEDGQLHYPVEAIVDAVLSIPGMKRKEIDDPQIGLEGFETNGWQWDWWQRFIYDGREYTLSGSGYYGGHRFQLADPK